MRQKCTFTGEVGRCRDIQPQKPEVRVTKAKPGQSVEQTLGAACTQQGHSEHLVYYVSQRPGNTPVTQSADLLHFRAQGATL